MSIRSMMILPRKMQAMMYENHVIQLNICKKCLDIEDREGKIERAEFELFDIQCHHPYVWRYLKDTDSLKAWYEREKEEQVKKVIAKKIWLEHA